MQAMNFGAMLPDVRANLPIPGWHISADLRVIARACVPGIQADCAEVPFTNIMVDSSLHSPLCFLGRLRKQEGSCSSMGKVALPITVKHSAGAAAELTEETAAPVTTVQLFLLRHS